MVSLTGFRIPRKMHEAYLGLSLSFSACARVCTFVRMCVVEWRVFPGRINRGAELILNVCRMVSWRRPRWNAREKL